MSHLRRTNRGIFDQAAAASRDRSKPPARREEMSTGVSLGWLLAGAAAGVLGYVAWRHFEPDFRRYMKMRAM